MRKIGNIYGRYNGKLSLSTMERVLRTNLIRFFITPAQKRHYTNSSVCWRQCGCLDEANNFHRFWSCSISSPFWREVDQTLRKVFQTDVPFKCVSLYLGVLPSENATSGGRYLFQVLSVASRKAITRKWLKAEKTYSG